VRQGAAASVMKLLPRILGVIELERRDCGRGWRAQCMHYLQASRISVVSFHRRFVKPAAIRNYRTSSSERNAEPNEI
jgi:hypothetical protein